MNHFNRTAQILHQISSVFILFLIVLQPFIPASFASNIDYGLPEIKTSYQVILANISDRTLTIYQQDISLESIVDIINKNFKTNIILEPDVKCSLNMRVEDKWYSVLQSAMDTCGLKISKFTDTFIIENNNLLKPTEQKAEPSNEILNSVMISLWNKYPELHEDYHDQSIYKSFISARDRYLSNKYTLADALINAEREVLIKNISTTPNTRQPKKVVPESKKPVTTKQKISFLNAVLGTTKEDCILENMKGVSSNTAAKAIYSACANKYPSSTTDSE